MAPPKRQGFCESAMYAGNTGDDRKVGTSNNTRLSHFICIIESWDAAAEAGSLIGTGLGMCATCDLCDDGGQNFSYDGAWALDS